MSRAPCHVHEHFHDDIHSADRQRRMTTTHEAPAIASVPVTIVTGFLGAGKTTLLQVICGTVSPTIRTVETNGRAAALLELGAGFNPESPGRDRSSQSRSGRHPEIQGRRVPAVRSSEKRGGDTSPTYDIMDGEEQASPTPEKR